MKKSILIGMTAVALTLGACGRKVPPAEIPPVEQPAADANSTDPNSLEVVELPALQADLVAKAGSDTVYFGTDEYSLDDFLVYTFYGHKREHAARFEAFGDRLDESKKDK